MPARACLPAGNSSQRIDMMSPPGSPQANPAEGRSSQRGRGKRAGATHGWANLSPVERQVVELASRGLSNPDIARGLFMSRNTVKAHLSHAYAKLGLASRTELAQLASRHSRDRHATSDEKSTHLGNVPRASCLSAWISLPDHDSISWTDHDGTRSRRIGRRLDYTMIEAAAGLFARNHGTGARLRHVFSSGVRRDGRTLRTSGPASGMSHHGPGMHTAADRATLPIAGRRPISGLLLSVGHGRPRSRRHDLCYRQ